MGLSSKLDSSNGHGHPPSNQTKGKRMRVNGDEREAKVATLGSIPKHRRSSSAQSTAKLPTII